MCIILAVYLIGTKGDWDSLNQQPPERPYFTPDELQHVLPIGRQKIYENLKDGTIPSIRLGKKYLIPKAAFNAWLGTCGGIQPRSL